MEKKYRTGLYSTDPRHLEEARAFINGREDRDKIMLEVLPLTNYVRSAEEHQHHLERHPEDCSYCHIPGCCPEQIQKSVNMHSCITPWKYQEQESAPLVREFLADTGMTAAQIERVAYLVGHH